MFLVLDVLALVALTVRPLEDASAVHLVVLPGAVVLAAIAPSVRALTLDVVGDEITLVAVAVSPGEHAVSLFDTSRVVAFELGAIGPALDSASILGVVLPEAAIE